MCADALVHWARHSTHSMYFLRKKLLLLMNIVIAASPLRGLILVMSVVHKKLCLRVSAGEGRLESTAPALNEKF